MGKMRMALRFLLLASALTFCLSACGGSSSSTAATSTAKTASWTNVSVRAYDGKVNINWDRAAGSSLGAALSTYNIYRSYDPAMLNSERIATNYDGTSFDYTNVNNGTRYYFTVTEVTTAGEGPASRVVSATPQEALPAAPYGLKVTSKRLSVILELKVPTPANSAIVSYNLYRSTTRDSFTTKIASNIYITNTDSTSNPTVTISADKLTTTIVYTDANSNLTSGMTYYYAATVVVSGKESGFSPVVSAEAQANIAAVDYDQSTGALAAFGSPADMSAEPGNGSASVTWSAAEAPTASTTTYTPYYTLYWSDSPDVLSNIKGHIDDAKDFTYKLNYLNNGTMYYFLVTVAVKDANGNGTPVSGPVISVTPALKTPAIPSGASATQGPQQVALTWSKDSSGITPVTYNIYFSTTNANSPAELMAIGQRIEREDPTKAYYNHTGLTLPAGTTCYYVITSVGEGESAPSGIISVTL